MVALICVCGARDWYKDKIWWKCRKCKRRIEAGLWITEYIIDGPNCKCGQRDWFRYKDRLWGMQAWICSYCKKRIKARGYDKYILDGPECKECGNNTWFMDKRRMENNKLRFETGWRCSCCGTWEPDFAFKDYQNIKYSILNKSRTPKVSIFKSRPSQSIL
jgi:hypothetical protein